MEMMKVLLKGHDYKYEVGELLKLFVPGNRIQFLNEKALGDNQSFLLVSSLWKKGEGVIAECGLFCGSKQILSKKLSYKDVDTLGHEGPKGIKRAIKLSIFHVLSEHFHMSPPWGILTGIRPSKIVHELMDQGMDGNAIEQQLRDDYKISREKINLVMEIALRERAILESNDALHYSLYISIPFCPTRCVYCSFPSNPVGNEKRDLVSSYLDALYFEIRETGKLLQSLGRKVDTLYIGGGTPTVLGAHDLDRLIREVKEYFDFSEVREITVEAGRPDTIDRKKLMVLKEHGVGRISINPQTMNEITLERMGRSHSPQAIKDAYALAKTVGFQTINMDLIIGLPGETPEMVEETMKDLLEMKPENITVHTLAVKKASKLKENLEAFELAQEEQAKKMLGIAEGYARQMGLHPYYMYRQKYMVGNLENIGYCLPGHACRYNIQIIEERQSIIALGAGAISKIYYSHENRLERVPNVTNVEQYIQRVEEMVEKKRIELEKQETVLTGNRT
ncbi:Oxygen-independent coproporphyrinogen-III oxidase-like protein HemZ [Thermotalea metallivorans]|uniref:Oxygen-independent coproporphyrinogen-III oxidase-like protein HemZ n=2 Tax=Thermotalea metallivorans TaxID=520762 RepID=A0A140L8W5_9FIRM|nr:Oxygen-independent coproporphyrinogen-III oxidase-like protein HemZ [Thermotalea metallivorans]